MNESRRPLLSLLKLKNIRLSKAMLNLIFLVAIFFLLVLSLISYQQVNKLIVANALVAHTYQVIQRIDSSLYSLVDAESQQRGYLIIGDEKLLGDIDNTKANLRTDLENLTLLTKDNPEQNQRVLRFKEAVSQRLDLLNQLMQLKAGDKLNTQEGIELFNQSQNSSLKVKGLGQEIKTVELVLLQERNALAIKGVKTTDLILIIGNSLSFIFLVVAFILANIELSSRKKTEFNNKNTQTRLRRIIESASDMIAAFDNNNRFIIFNDAYQREFKQLFGKSIVVGMSLDEAFAGIQPSKQAFAEEWKKSLESYDEITNIEYSEANEKNTYEVTGNLVQNDNNEIIGVVQSLRNINKRIQEHTELQQSYEKQAIGMKALQEKNEQITLLVEMSDIMLACNSQEELSHVMSKYSQRLLNFARGYLYVMHPSKNYLEVATSWGNPDIQNPTFAPDECWAIKLGRRHVVGIAHKELVCDHIKQTDAPDIAYLCVPLMAQNDIYGLLYLEIQTIDTMAFDENQQLLINALAELTALALANVRLRDNLRYQSIRDPLTGLYNRRYLDDFLFKQIHQAERTKSQVSVLMLDLDHFKKINDTYGHDAGDAVLKELGKLLQTDIRLGDIATRFGGEEFIVILYNITIKDSIQRAETIRQSVSAIQIKYGAQPVGPLSISIGIAQYPTDGTTPAELVEAADKALYYAKKNGRNQVAVYTEIKTMAELDTGK